MTMTSYTKRCTRTRRVWRVCWCKFEWNPTRSFRVICNLVSLSLIQRQGLSLDFACLFIYSLAIGPELFVCLSIYENAETLSRIVLKFHLYWFTLKNCLWQTVVRAVVMCAPPPRASIASHCVQPPRATILFHFSAPKSLFLRDVDVHTRFDTTPIYLYSFYLLAPLQRLIATLGSTQIYCRFHIRVWLNCLTIAFHKL